MVSDINIFINVFINSKMISDEYYYNKIFSENNCKENKCNKLKYIYKNILLYHKNASMRSYSIELRTAINLKWCRLVRYKNINSIRKWV